MHKNIQLIPIPVLAIWWMIISKVVYTRKSRNVLVECKQSVVFCPEYVLYWCFATIASTTSSLPYYCKHMWFHSEWKEIQKWENILLPLQSHVKHCNAWLCNDPPLPREYILVNSYICSNWLALRWRHNDHDDGSNHQPHGCLLNRLFRRKSKKTSKLRVTGLCVGNSPGPVNSPHKGPVTRKMFPFDDVIMGSRVSNKTGIYLYMLPYLEKNMN